MNYVAYIKYLNELKKIIEGEGFRFNGFESAIEKIKGSKDLKYSVKPIKLEIKGKFPKRMSHTGIKILELEFDMNLDGNFEDAMAGKDPFSSYVLNIVLYGLDNSNMLYNAIHLDRHDGSESNSVHPYYHFHFGGNRLTDNVENYGQILILDSPRLMHHPLDFILAVDFIISNFAPESWHRLKKNSNYISILQKAQKIFVEPYFRTLIKFFDGVSSPWSHQELYPQLV